MKKKKISESMKRDTLAIAEAFIDEEGTCRSVAQEFEVSKSCIHHRLTKVLPYVSKSTYNKVRKLLDKNKAERAIRGGKATHDKYEMLNGGCTKKVEKKATDKKANTSKGKASSTKKSKASKSK